MKQPLRIEDNSERSKEYFKVIPKLTVSISDKTLEQLEKEGIFVFPEILKEAEDVTKDQMILQSVNDSYVSGNIMGYIGQDGERLEITSRFSRGDKDYLFHYLLEKVVGIPNLVSLDTYADDSDRIYRLLMFMFPMYLQNALRKGLYKEYTLNQYNDSNVKGHIDVARHIKVNTPFIGRVAYSQREHVNDNPMMQLIRHTIEFIKRKPYGIKLLNKTKEEVQAVIEATPSFDQKNLRKVLVDSKKNPVRHAYYHEYRDLQRLCILILQNSRHSIGAGSSKMYGVLFDGAWLWEEYINTLIKKDFYHPRNKAKEGYQWLFSDKGKVGKIYPDFIGRNSGNRIIADAKYKPQRNISGDDYLQVLAYMYRFDAKMSFYFYPKTAIEGEGDRMLYLNEGVSFEGPVKKRDDVVLYKYGLEIPENVGSYEEFTKIISEKEKSFREGIYTRIQTVNGSIPFTTIT